MEANANTDAAVKEHTTGIPARPPRLEEGHYQELLRAMAEQAMIFRSALMVMEQRCVGLERQVTALRRALETKESISR